jgi:hypothetical protein
LRSSTSCPNQGRANLADNGASRRPCNARDQTNSEHRRDPNAAGSRDAESGSSAESKTTAKEGGVVPKRQSANQAAHGLTCRREVACKSLSRRQIRARRDVGGDDDRSAAALGDASGDLLEILRTAGRDDHVGTGVGEAQGDAATDAAPGTGDDGDHAVHPEQLHHIGVRRVDGRVGSALLVRHGMLLFMLSRPAAHELLGATFPGGRTRLAYWENYLLTDCTTAAQLPDSLGHPVALFAPWRRHGSPTR